VNEPIPHEKYMPRRWCFADAGIKERINDGMWYRSCNNLFPYLSRIKMIMDTIVAIVKEEN